MVEALVRVPGLSLNANVYTTESGNSYTLFSKSYTIIKNKKDIEWFEKFPKRFEVKKVLSGKRSLPKIEEKRKEDEKKKFRKQLTDLKGIEDEIANVIMDQFNSFEDFSKITGFQLERLPGIGKKRAKIIKEQLQKLKR